MHHIPPTEGMPAPICVRLPTKGHEGKNDYVRMNPVATEIIRQGVGVYTT